MAIISFFFLVLLKKFLVFFLILSWCIILGEKMSSLDFEGTALLLHCFQFSCCETHAFRFWFFFLGMKSIPRLPPEACRLFSCPHRAESSQWCACPESNSIHFTAHLVDTFGLEIYVFQFYRSLRLFLISSSLFSFWNSYYLDIRSQLCPLFFKKHMFFFLISHTVFGSIFGIFLHLNLLLLPFSFSFMLSYF